MSLVKRFGPPAAGATVEIAPAASDAVAWLADIIANTIYDFGDVHGRRPSIALSGGSTPGAVYERLAAAYPALVRRALWCQADERDVAPDDPASNRGMICRTLFGARPAEPPANFLAVPLPAADARSAALAYSRLLATHLAELGAGSIDIVLLGIGEDGHTASLFPGTGWRTLSEPLFAAVDAPLPAGRRYTLTLNGILEAKHRIWIVRGEAKAGIVRRILRDAPEHLPAGAIVRAAETRWLLDTGAAASL